MRQFFLYIANGDTNRRSPILVNASRCSFEDWNLENDTPRPDLDNNSERIREECWNGDEAFEVRVTVGLPLPSTPSFLPLIFFPQLGHDSSNSRNWSCNNLLSGIHRRSSPDQSVITLLPFLPSPGYTWPSHAESQSSPLNPSLPLSLLSHGKSYRKEKWTSSTWLRNVVFPITNLSIVFFSSFWLNE